MNPATPHWHVEQPHWHVEQHLAVEVDFTQLERWDEGGYPNLELPDELPFDDATCECGTTIGAYLDERELWEQARMGIKQTFRCVLCGAYLCEDCADEGVVLEPGRRYRVVMVIPGVWNAPRTAVMGFLGMNGTNLSFNLRPVAGTQELDPQYIRLIQPTEDEVHAPRR